jgi:hypothetical protein
MTYTHINTGIYFGNQYAADTCVIPVILMLGHINACYSNVMNAWLVPLLRNQDHHSSVPQTFLGRGPLLASKNSQGSSHPRSHIYIE